MIKKSKLPKITYKKLGKYGALGFYYNVGNQHFIEIDERLFGKEHLNTICHEIGHYLFPELPERKIIRLGNVFAELLWAQGFREVVDCIKKKTRKKKKKV